MPEDQIFITDHGEYMKDMSLDEQIAHLEKYQIIYHVFFWELEIDDPAFYGALKQLFECTRALDARKCMRTLSDMSTEKLEQALGDICKEHL